MSIFIRPEDNEFSPVFLKEVKPGSYISIPNFNIKLKPLKIKKGGVLHESK